MTDIINENNCTEFLAKFREFNFGSYTRGLLENLYTILCHRKEIDYKPFPIGFLLQCDYDDYAEEFVKKLNSVLKEAELIETELQIKEEGNLYSYGSTASVNSSKKSSILFIRNCKVPKSTESYQGFYNSVEKLQKDNPNLIVIAVVSHAVVNAHWKQDPRLYFRMFSHHLLLNDKRIYQIHQLVLDDLSARNITWTDEFKDKLYEYIQNVYPSADLKLSVFVQDMVRRILLNYYSSVDLLKSEEQLPLLTVENVPAFRLPEDYETVISSLSEMVGTQSIQEQFAQIYRSQQFHPIGAKLRMHMAFTGGPGTGKTTVAQQMAKMLHAMGILKSSKLVIAKPTDLTSKYDQETRERTEALIKRALDGVLFIDEAYTLASTPNSYENRSTPEQQVVVALLQAMETYSDRLVVIFAGYRQAIDKLLDTNEGLKSRIGYFIEFPDFTEEQLLEIFQRKCTLNKISLADDDALRALKERIHQEKLSDNFGNARSIENLFLEVYSRANKEIPGTDVFTESQISKQLNKEPETSMDQIIGMDEIKEALKNYEKRANYIYELQKRGCKIKDVPKHMLFIGKPGTGKTTVAKAIASDLYKAHVITRNTCTIIGSRDLSGFSGSGTKFAEILQKARGGVLLIDEAYSILSLASREEIIATLLTEMEDHPETIIIFAGYPDEMNEFVSSNPGLSSRIANTFYFDSFDLTTLMDMYEKILTDYGFELSEGVRETAAETTEFFMDMDEFGNGRFIRNLVDMTIEIRSGRSYDADNLFQITVNDVPGIEDVKRSVTSGVYLMDPNEISESHMYRTAIHEMGHTIITLMKLNGMASVTKVTIESNAGAYGYMESCTITDVYTNTFLFGRICSALGGRNAERLIFGNHSIGCSADYESAKTIAAAMLEKYAMGDFVGDSNVVKLLMKADVEVTRILMENKDLLIFLANVLFQNKTLSGEELMEAIMAYEELFAADDSNDENEE